VKIRIISGMEEFEEFTNDHTKRIISVDVKAVEQNCRFQEWFVAVVAYEDCVDSLQPMKAEIAFLVERLYQLNVGSRATRQDIDDIIKLRQLSAILSTVVRNSYGGIVC
jgi:hypothetical protein